MTSFTTMAGESEAALVNPIVIFTVLIICGTLFIVSWLTKKRNNSSTNIKESNKTKGRGRNLHTTVNKNETTSHISKKKAPGAQKGNPVSQNRFIHDHLLASLKGHTAPVTGGDFSSNGKHFITSAQDRTVLIWSVKDFPNRNRKSFRGNIEFDHAEHVCWSPDSKAFIIYSAFENCLTVYKVHKKSDGSIGSMQKAITFPQYNPDAILVALSVAVNGRFIMTCDNKNQLTLWDLRGGILDKFDTKHGETYSAVLSSCGRYIATTGFTPDVKVYEVRFNKSGSYDCMKRIFELKGHMSGIYTCSFNCDSSKMVSVSKDGTWRLYNTRVEYDKGQEPYFLLSGKFKKEPSPATIAISPDGRTIALATGPNLIFYSAITGEELYSISDIYLDYIKQVKFDPASEFVLTLGDKHVTIFYNVAGYQTTIQDLENSKTKATTSAMRERIDNQIKEAKEALKIMNKQIVSSK